MFKIGNLVKIKNSVKEPRYIKYRGHQGVIENIYQGIVEDMAQISFDKIGRTICNLSRLELIAEGKFKLKEIKCRKNMPEIEPKSDVKVKSIKELFRFLISNKRK